MDAEKHRQSSKKYRKNHPQVVSDYNAWYYEQNKEKLRVAHNEWYQAHKAEILARKKEKYKLAKEQDLKSDDELGE